MALEELSCADSAKPEMKPVSCCGKNPLGMSTNSATVAARVATNTASVMRSWRSAASRPRR